MNIFFKVEILLIVVISTLWVGVKQVYAQDALYKSCVSVSLGSFTCNDSEFNNKISYNGRCICVSEQGMQVYENLSDLKNNCDGVWDEDTWSCLDIEPLPNGSATCPDGSAPQPRGEGRGTLFFCPKTPSKIIRPEFCDDSTDLNTALGCIPTDPQTFIGWVIKLSLSAGGGIAFLMMSVGAFILMTSSGNPEQVKKGQEIVVGALTGLLFIIFSIFLLKVIGADILQIPGFS